MDFADPYVIATAVIAVVLGLIYWFKIRDDGAWDKDAKVKLSTIDYGALAKQTDAGAAQVSLLAPPSPSYYYSIYHFCMLTAWRGTHGLLVNRKLFKFLETNPCELSTLFWMTAALFPLLLLAFLYINPYSLCTFACESPTLPRVGVIPFSVLRQQRNPQRLAWLLRSLTVSF